MTRTATFNGVRYASYLDAANVARPLINAATGVFPVVEVWNDDGTLYKSYCLGKQPTPVAVTPVVPAPKADEVAELRTRVETLEALVAQLVSASLEAPAPKAKRGRKASVGVPFDDPLPQVG